MHNDEPHTECFYDDDLRATLDPELVKDATRVEMELLLYGVSLL